MDSFQGNNGKYVFRKFTEFQSIKVYTDIEDVGISFQGI